jgi:hypothetical protein
MVLFGVFSRPQEADSSASKNSDSRRDLDLDSGSLDAKNGSGEETC